ncbi:MAG: cytochrome C6, partial [Cyanobacteria bacterium J06659_2]
IVTQGKNNMSAYGDRLSPVEIEAVAVYVWQQAQADWPRK